MSHIFVSDMAKAKIINEKTAYEKLNHQKVVPKLTYYRRSYSTMNNENISNMGLDSYYHLSKI